MSIAIRLDACPKVHIIQFTYGSSLFWQQAVVTDVGDGSDDTLRRIIEAIEPNVVGAKRFEAYDLEVQLHHTATVAAGE
jgi:hypothetical protein